jgi:CPA2 family monovalent cation:H+ antiporter-2
MGHLPKLIEDLELILFTGAVTTLLFKWIKQPLVLGYIIAGFLVGPHLSITPTVADTENVKTLAEIGVIFLLFSLGLEFSFKKLMRVGGSASITAFVDPVHHRERLCRGQVDGLVYDGQCLFRGDAGQFFYDHYYPGL